MGSKKRTEPRATKAGQLRPATAEQAALAHEADAPGPPVPATPWVAIVALLLAAGTSAFLLQHALVGGSATGCGPGSGCDVVLSSHWSRWFGVPVAGLSLLVYLGMLATLLALRAERPAVTRRRLAQVAVALAATALGAAAWFGILQVAVVGALCKYCLTVHVAGIVGAVLVLRAALGVAATGTAPLVAATVMLGVLIGGQLGPSSATYTVAPAPEVLGPTAKPYTGGGIVAIETPPPPEIGPGALPMDVAQVPVLGKRDAKFRILELFDYACSHCRALHGYMKDVRRRYGADLAILAAPMPLDAKCNPYNPTAEPPFHESCERARIALALWRLQPTSFERFDDWMFAESTPRTAADTRAWVAQLVGADTLTQELRDPWIDAVIKQAVELQHQSAGPNNETDKVPKLFLDGKMMAGVPGSADELQTEIAGILGR